MPEPVVANGETAMLKVHKARRRAIMRKAEMGKDALAARGKLVKAEVKEVPEAAADLAVEDSNLHQA